MHVYIYRCILCVCVCVYIYIVYMGYFQRVILYVEKKRKMPIF